MVSGVEFVTAIVGVIALLGTAGGWLARRDNQLEEKVEATGEDVDELDTAFARLTTRLFGHPADASDSGALSARQQRIESAEEDIDSLSDGVQHAIDQAEENGDHLEELEGRVTDHAAQTRAALARIEEQLGDVDLVPKEEDDFLRGGDD